MNDIKLLDKNTIDKIAAGEVVDRPASIVKELIENAIDAGADRISIEIKDGGASLVRITDNGSGIRDDQIDLAFQRHSTSKITSASDLSFIHTLGFRGEALSSIAAVSRTELCTKPRESLAGTIYKINGGVRDSIEQAGLPNGTTIIVRDLFYNTPARLKFLKSSQTEAAYCLEVVQHIALSRPDISFKFTSNGAVRLSTTGNGSLKDTVYCVFGRDITANLLEIEDNRDILTVSGFIGKPVIARGNRNFEYFYVNGRYIKDPVIRKALEDAYTGYQMKGSFPFAVLDIRIETELVDVNVHPSKMEIRFFNNEAVYNAIYDIIRSRIVSRESIPDVSIGKDKTAAADKPGKDTYVPEPFEQKQTVLGNPGFLKEERPYGDYSEVEKHSHSLNGNDILSLSSSNETDSSDSFAAAASFDQSGLAGSALLFGKQTASEMNISYPDETGDPVGVSVGNEKPVCPERRDFYSSADGSSEQLSLFKDNFLSEQSVPRHRIVGEVFDTYWIVEFEEKVYFIDQHAAHEKVLYERFMKNIKNGTHYSQQLMPAVIVSLSSQEEETLKKYTSALREMGFDTEHFGGSEYAISSVPTDVYSVDPKLLFLEILNDLGNSYSGKDPSVLSDRVATAACKAAVKGGNVLSRTEVNVLIEELLGLDNPYNCPHGRPTIISMSKYELEKKFKRII